MHPNLKKKLLLAVGILWLLYSLIIIIPGYITSLKSDVAEHAVLSYISAMGWEEEVVSVTGGLMGDANQYPVYVEYHNDELNYNHFISLVNGEKRLVYQHHLFLKSMYRLILREKKSPIISLIIMNIGIITTCVTPYILTTIRITWKRWS